MSNGPPTSLETILWASAPRWKHRNRTVFLEFIGGLPVCIGLGVAVNLWREHAETAAMVAAILGFLLTLTGIILLVRWYKQEAAWKRSEMLSRARASGYSEEEVVAYEDQWEREAENSE